MLKRVGVLAGFLAAVWLAVLPAQAASDSLAAARSLLDGGHEREAVSMLQRMVHQSDSEYQAWFLLGVAYARQQQYHEAIEAFRKVSSLRPDLAEPHNNLAVIYNELGDLRAAVSELEVSLAKNPNYSTAQENLGDLYVKLALQAYEKSLAQAPNDELQVRYDRLLQVRMTTPSARVDAEGAQVAQQAATKQADASDAAKPATSPSAATVPDAAEAPAATAEAVKPSPKVAQVSPATAVHSAGDQVADVQKQMRATDPAAAVLAAIEAWRKAWSERDVGAYIAAYAPDFGPGGNFATRGDWESYKQRVIGGKKFIRVTLDEVQVSMADDSTARVRFVQHFRSNNYNSDDRKELTLRKAEDGWKITDEQAL